MESFSRLDAKTAPLSGSCFPASSMCSTAHGALFGSAVAVSGTGQGETPESLAAPAFTGFPPIAESGTKVALTTGMTTDRKIFIFTACRGIMAEK